MRQFHVSAVRAFPAVKRDGFSTMRQFQETAERASQTVKRCDSQTMRQFHVSAVRASQTVKRCDSQTMRQSPVFDETPQKFNPDSAGFLRAKVVFFIASDY